MTAQRSTGHGSTGHGSDADLRETVIGSRLIHRGRVGDYRIDTVRLADGRESSREILGHPGAVAILALDPHDRVLLVRQWRAAAGRALLEIPAGTLDITDPATRTIEDPALAAPRELEEETGYRAATWRKLGAFWTVPGFASELMHLYVATGLPAGRRGSARAGRGRAARAHPAALARGGPGGRGRHDLRREVDRRTVLAGTPEGGRGRLNWPAGPSRPRPAIRPGRPASGEGCRSAPGSGRVWRSADRRAP